MSARPVLHVTNWSSRKLHGPGRHFTIMARPRPWEWGTGRVPLLTPAVEDLDAVRLGSIDVETYRRRFFDRCARIVARGETFGRQGLPWALEPGKLFAIRTGGATAAPGPVARTTSDRGVLLEDGDTLCCACSREQAGAGRCHRAWAAELLVEAGWGVVLDGKARGL